MKKLLVVIALLACVAALEKPEDHCWSVTDINGNAQNFSESMYQNDSYSDFDASFYIHEAGEEFDSDGFQYDV